jgi:hypothetical protein
MINLILAGFIAMAAGAPKTEVQVNICEGSATLAQKLNLATWEQELSEEFYLIDNKGLQLYNKSWVLRARIDRIEDTVEIVLKYNQASAALEGDSKKCEFDLHGTAKKWACKMSNQLSFEDFTQFQNNKDFAGMLSAEQKAWLQSENQSLPSNLEITTAFTDQSMTNDQKISLGVSTNIDRTEFIEASTRVKSDDALDAQAKLLSYLKSKMVVLCADQGPLLTRLKLESFFKRR